MARRTAPLRKAAADASPRGRASEEIDFGPFDDFIGYQLRMAQIASFQSYARHAQGIGLSPGRFAALVLIDRKLRVMVIAALMVMAQKLRFTRATNVRSGK